MPARRDFGRLMNSIPKVVFSRTRSEAAWGPVRLVRENVAEEIARMKTQAGKDLVLFAGADLAATFMNLDLVDEYRLMIDPIVLGNGIALFGKVEAERPLRLLGVDAFPSEVVLLRYERNRTV
jgi:dihydrofolate reductase